MKTASEVADGITDGQKKIHGLTPANGWIALFADLDKPGELIESPIACWAIYEDKHGMQYVEGMIPEGKWLSPPTNSDSFLAYREKATIEAEDFAELKAEAELFVEKQREENHGRN